MQIAKLLFTLQLFSLDGRTWSWWYQRPKILLIFFGTKKRFIKCFFVCLSPARLELIITYYIAFNILILKIFFVPCDSQGKDTIIKYG